MRTGSILFLFMTSTLIISLGFSDMQASGLSTNTNQTNSGTNQTDAITNQTLTNSTLAGNNQTYNISNQTGINAVNSTATENIGQQISSFVHSATSLFQQQRNETIQAIQDCHQKMRTATSDNRTQIIDECQTTLNAINEKYQDVRNQFQVLFKQFRENIITLRHQAEGLQVSEHDQANAIRNINEDAAKHGLTDIKIALQHMKGMWMNGRIGIERALQHVNETSESNQSGTTFTPLTPPSPTAATHGMPVIPPIPVQSTNQGSHGPPSLPGQSGSHGKH